MPYVKSSQKEILESELKMLNGALQGLAVNDQGDIDPGIINYTLTRILIDLKHKGNYKNYNALVGVLESCKLEFYRRAVATYEDKKRDENGEVYHS